MKALLITRGEHKATQLQTLTALADKGIAAAAKHRHALQQADQEHQACVEKITSVLRGLPNLQLSIHKINSNTSCPDGAFDLVFAVGGDGTVLYANHALPSEQGLIVGVRSSRGSVGHLCAYDYRRLDLLAAAVQQNKFKATSLQRLQALITTAAHQEHTSAVLNDFLFANSNPAATTRYMLNFRKQWETHKSSGIWVATAAGSSAALRAAGGKAMAITTNKLQFLVRELYQPLTSDMRSAEFDCEQDMFKIVSLCDAAMLSLDGQYRMLTINYGDTIVFRPAPPLRISLAC
ncbi:MAG: hypothetical protein OYH77_03515 [Pseudomonadota bacterium]|nr:hypothetical protein [Pseudomonadota bacterium]